MIAIPGYKLNEKLYHGSQSVIYRACCREDDKPVVLKILHREQPTPEEIARFRREFAITSSLEPGGVIKAFNLVRSRDNLIMVLEDFGGESLARLKELNVLQLTLKEFLCLALRVTDILSDIHRQSIIHKDINPSHILWNRDTGEIKLIDFGISTVLPRETAAHTNPGALAGTLAYMSPEQTGRMNRSLDYRTDFYSLGVTFYELLTSQLPFAGADSLELVHAHIAKIPAAPHRCRPDIPEPVSNIVMKLMAKNAEDRYQGAHGLKYDLQQCLDQLKAAGNIQRFKIGKTDYPEKFQVPQKLYGREKEIETLLEGFERVCGGPTEMMLVTGYTGIGKTSLVREMLKTIAAKQGYFITGKFDRLKRNIPYAPFIRAFRRLVRQILTGTGKQVTTWKKRILQAVGVNGQVIIDVIPDVELVIGKQPPVPDLLPIESKNRFHHVFENFVRVFAGQEHPLIIFLDDLQWIDLPSLKLVELFVSDPGTRYLFFIGAYRDNEVEPMHPLMLSIKSLKEKGCDITTITLPPLGPGEVNQLIADALHCGIKTSKPLSDLCLQKTGGNPFFLNQFLQTLYQQHLVEFDREHGKWRWNIKKIQQAGLTDNVVELMVARLRQLPAKTREVLKIAMNILMNMDAPSYYMDQELFAFVSALKVRLSLEYGHVPASCAGYSTYGIMCGAAAGDYQTGFAFGQLAFQLSEKFHDPGQKCKSSVVLANYLNSWVRHIKESEAINEEGYQAGLNGGELEYAGYILGHLVYSDFFQGKNLEYISKKNENYLDFLQKTNNMIQVHGIIGLQMVIGNLRGETAGKFSFDTAAASEKQYIERGRRHRTFTTLCDYYIFKTRALYLYQQHAKALESILKAGELLPYITNRFASAEHNFYYSLILAGLYPGAPADKKKEYRDRLDQNQKQVKKWADNCPENFQHKYLLVEAELSRIQGKNWQTAELYDQAIDTAGKNEFRQDETLANELAGRFWLEKGKTDFARIYMDRAYYGYRLWGAKRKLEDLEEKYPQLLPLSLAGGAKMAQQLDVSSLMKATRCLSAEIVLSNLLEKMMHLIIENAGARKGLLVLEHENRLFIRLECAVERDILLSPSIPLEEASTIGQPASLIRFAARTRENLVLNNASSEGDFITDPYIVKNKPRSVICTPIIHQGKLTGIIYLENNLTPGAFTADRLEVINILSAQAAVSIENARLYQTLEARVEERTGQLRDEKERAEMILEGLKAALREKEILLKEIHHRVKNNLQIASSLLSLQAFKIEDEQLINVLNDSIKRINSMAEIHKLLYETGSFVRIPFDRYLREISSNWHDTYADKSPGITIKPGAKNIFLDIEKAIPCALIVNELLSNAFKYAFPGRQSGEIKVRLFEKDNEYTLIVSDNGVGFPKDLDIRSANSLGMTIVRNLTAQLRGDLRLDRRKGAAITLTFPKSSPGGKSKLRKEK
jgi:two-component sensor histidine kinase/tRNA A-37 threonylcarbamoyl transferase component Bud32